MTQFNQFSLDRFKEEWHTLLTSLAKKPSLNEARRELFAWVNHTQRAAQIAQQETWHRNSTIIRDCARALRSLFSERAEKLAGVSLVSDLHDIAKGFPVPNLTPGFFAEVTHLFRGLTRHPDAEAFPMGKHFEALKGREAALARSADLDQLWMQVEKRLERFADGLAPPARERRSARRDRILAAFNATPQNWADWNWQVANLITTREQLTELVTLTPSEREAVDILTTNRLPFGITPYYLALLDDDPAAGLDRAIRAQVLPPPVLAKAMAARGDHRREEMDFMRESDTSPVDLITRRYPAICIFKPFNTCPQICAYCQRNWEIDQAMDPAALASSAAIDTALSWIEDHPAIREVLVTGGDPLAMPDSLIRSILERLSRIPHINVIRFGSRVPVTMPMRLTPELVETMASFREPGRREICLVTHVQHPYEITPDLVTAVDRVRRAGISVYNQLVYTFFVSRRFEAARLRMLLRQCGIDPYYTFVPKGKEETGSYRVPLARLLQERKEEARLLPGLWRTDEPVYNLPALGKNHIRAIQDRDLIGIHPDGSRVYEFHPWEKNILDRGSYVGRDIPLIEYLQRLADIGEDPDDYAGIWYYY
jgi:lysine 2,3-aminomutase